MFEDVPVGGHLLQAYNVNQYFPEVCYSYRQRILLCDDAQCMNTCILQSCTRLEVIMAALASLILLCESGEHAVALEHPCSNTMTQCPSNTCGHACMAFKRWHARFIIGLCRVCKCIDIFTKPRILNMTVPTSCFFLCTKFSCSRPVSLAHYPRFALISADYSRHGQVRALQSDTCCTGTCRDFGKCRTTSMLD